MKYYKVYAQCCISAHPYKEVFESDLDDYFNVIIDDAMDKGLIDWVDDELKCDDLISNAYDKIKKHFEDTGVLNCGDYQIIRANELLEVKRPNVCGYDTTLILSE